MAKVNLTSLGSRYGSVDALNANFDAIEEGFNNTLSRDGTGPNAMEASLDMNGYNVLNASSVSTDSLTINGELVVPSDLAITTLPSQSGQSGKSLFTDGSAAYWKLPAASDATFTQTGGTATTVDAHLKLGTRLMRSFGAVGDGVTDDTVAVKAALESGYVVDGELRTYAINNTLTPTSFKGLMNATLKQIGSRTTTNATTLDLRGMSNYFLFNVEVNMGNDVTTLFSDDGNNGLYCGGSTTGSGTGETTVYAENFHLEKVRVTGSGCGTGVHIRHAKNFTVVGCSVYDRVSGSSPDPTNDSQNGFQINNCTEFSMDGCYVRNLKTRLGGTPTLKWTRGFLFSEISNASIAGCVAVECDQTYDFSGAVSNTSSSEYKGNRSFTLSNSISKKAGTWGFKFANVTHDASITGCVAEESGAAGFVISSQATAISLANDNFRTQNLTFSNCRAVNVKGTSWATARATGFYLIGISGHTYPRGIRFLHCDVSDYQNTPTTTVGFEYTDPTPSEYPSAGYDKAVASYTVGCNVYGVATPFSSISSMVCTTTGTTTQSVPNSTWTQLNWDNDVADFCGLHSTASNNNAVYVKTPGWYDVHARVRFAANGTGDRRIRFTKNGTSIDRTDVIETPSATITCNVESTTSVYLKNGEYVGVEAYQDSGGALNAVLNESVFIVKLDA